MPAVKACPDDESLRLSCKITRGEKGFAKVASPVGKEKIVLNSVFQLPSATVVFVPLFLTKLVHAPKRL